MVVGGEPTANDKEKLETGGQDGTFSDIYRLFLVMIVLTNEEVSV